MAHCRRKASCQMIYPLAQNFWLSIKICAKISLISRYAMMRLSRKTNGSRSYGVIDWVEAMTWQKMYTHSFHWTEYASFHQERCYMTTQSFLIAKICTKTVHVIRPSFDHLVDKFRLQTHLTATCKTFLRTTSICCSQHGHRQMISIMTK